MPHLREGVLSFLLLLQITAAAAVPVPPCYEAGYYLSTSTTCTECPAGSYCDQGTSYQTLCPPGKYQTLKLQTACLDCPEGYYCRNNGTVTPVACPAGTVTPSGSTACSTACDYENYYYSTTLKACQKRTVVCNYDTQYEVQTLLNQTTERQCRALSTCSTNRLPAESPIMGGPAGVALFAPLQEYIVKYHTRYSNRVCKSWASMRCPETYYVEQLPEDDGTGFLTRPMICKPLSGPADISKQYKLVDGSVTRDRDNVWVYCTVCDYRTQYQVQACSAALDTVCKSKTVCEPRYEYVQRAGEFMLHWFPVSSFITPDHH